MPSIKFEVKNVTILMYYPDHNPPHVHVRYEGREFKLEIRTGALIGSCRSRRVLEKARKFVSQNQVDLMELWESKNS